MTSGQIGCAESDIRILNDAPDLLVRTWTAECHGRRYYCSAHGGGTHGATQVACKESSTTTASNSSGGSTSAATPIVLRSFESDGISFDLPREMEQTASDPEKFLDAKGRVVVRLGTEAHAGDVASYVRLKFANATVRPPKSEGDPKRVVEFMLNGRHRLVAVMIVGRSARLVSCSHEPDSSIGASLCELIMDSVNMSATRRSGDRPAPTQSL